MLYVLTMILLIVLYVAALLNMRRLRNTALWNALFTILIFGFYLCVVTRAYLADGFYDWNFRNTLPTANVSPFMFTLVVIMHIFPKKIKRYFYLLISLLSVGMIISPMLAVGMRPRRVFAIALITGLFEVIGTLLGYFAVNVSLSVLPFGLAFAGGTMLYVIVDEMIPETHSGDDHRGATYALLAGFCIMLLLGALMP